MFTYLIETVKNLNKTRNYLLLANVFLALFLIILNNAGVIPLGTGDFVFFSVIFLAFALYRPGWAFLFFVGAIMLENINLAPLNLGIAVRPYQLIGALIILAILIRLAFRRLNFSLGGWKWYDGLIVLINISSFFSLVNAPDKIFSLKLVVILASFSLLYFLTRIYIKTAEDLKKIIPFFLGSSAVIVLYGIWQNIAYLNGGLGFEIMPGRPNSTFTEADWLGGFIILVIAVLYGIIYLYVIARESSDSPRWSFGEAGRGNLEINTDLPAISRLLRFARKDMYIYLLLIFAYLLLILAVSRSAWLGAFAVTFIFLFITLTDLKFRNLPAGRQGWQWGGFERILRNIAIAIICSIGIIYVFRLTDFQLFNRAKSTGTGLQKITISCGKEIDLPQNIADTAELERYDCRHINLEEIESEKTVGNYVTEVYRNDPNVDIRSRIYQKSWQEIKKHPVLGIGWGSIGPILGTDERGASLNSSNIFLEIWLGAGLVGLLAFVAILLYILFRAIAGYYQARSTEQKAVSIFIISSWFGLIVFNLFNAGIFLAFFWVWLGISFLKYEDRN